MRIVILLSVALIVAYISTNTITNIALHGAQQGSSDISKEITWEARMSPNIAKDKFYPMALGLGSILGILVFSVGYFLTKPKKS